MKKINSIKQLKAEKQKMAQHQVILEDKIRDDWSDIRSNMKPSALAKETFSKLLSYNPKKQTLFGKLLKVGSIFLLERMIQKKLSRLFRKK